MELPFSQYPRLLKALTWLLLIGGILQAVNAVTLWSLGQPVRLASVGAAILALSAGWDLKQGRRRAIDWLLLAHAVPTGLLVYYGIRIGFAWPWWNWLVIAWVAAVCGYLVWCRRSLAWREPGSYQDWLTNPGYRDAVSDWFAERDARLAADRSSPPDPDELIGELLTDDDSEMIRHRLQALAEREPDAVHDAILRAIDDEAFQAYPGALELLCKLLPDEVRIANAGRLEPRVDDLTGFQRGRLLGSLARTGDAAFAQRCINALGSDNDRDHVASGIADALEADRCSPALRAAVEPGLRAGLQSSHAEACAAALARIDTDLAGDLIARADLSRPDDLAQLRAIVGIAKAGLPLPAQPMTDLVRRACDHQAWFWTFQLLPFVELSDEELHSLLGKLPDSFGTHGAELTYRAVLRHLVARHGHAAEPALQAAIALDRADVSDAAAELLAELAGLPDSLWFEEDQQLTPIQRQLQCLLGAQAYARNGGIVHAVECLAPEDIDELDNALERIAPARVRRVWTEAIALLSPSGLPREQSSRQELIAARFDHVKQDLDQLDRAFYAVAHALDVHCYLFAIEHRDEIFGA